MTRPSDEGRCDICGEPMPEGETMFRMHGYSGPCSKPPLQKQSVDTIESLRAERDALAADAARYRWLRGSKEIPMHSVRWARWEVKEWDGRYWQTLFAEQIDAAIDAALKDKP